MAKRRAGLSPNTPYPPRSRTFTAKADAETPGRARRTCHLFRTKIGDFWPASDTANFSPVVERPTGPKRHVQIHQTVALRAMRLRNLHGLYRYRWTTRLKGHSAPARSASAAQLPTGFEWGRSGPLRTGPAGGSCVHPSCTWRIPHPSRPRAPHHRNPELRDHPETYMAETCLVSSETYCSPVNRCCKTRRSSTSHLAALDGSRLSFDPAASVTMGAKRPFAACCTSIRYGPYWKAAECFGSPWLPRWRERPQVHCPDF